MMDAAMNIWTIRANRMETRRTLEVFGPARTLTSACGLVLRMRNDGPIAMSRVPKTPQEARHCSLLKNAERRDCASGAGDRGAAPGDEP